MQMPVFALSRPSPGNATKILDKINSLWRCPKSRCRAILENLSDLSGNSTDSDNGSKCFPVGRCAYKQTSDANKQAEQEAFDSANAAHVTEAKADSDANDAADAAKGAAESADDAQQKADDAQDKADNAQEQVDLGGNGSAAAAASDASAAQSDAETSSLTKILRISNNNALMQMIPTPRR